MNQNFQTMPPVMRFIFARIFPWPFLLSGILGTFFGCRQFILAQQSVDWPSTSGVVFVSQIDEHSDSHGTTFEANITYSYQVAGVKFSSNRVSFGDYGSSDPEHAQEIVNRYPLNSAVVVHYQPGNPRKAALETGLKTATYICLIGGLVFMLIGSAMVIYMPWILQRLDKRVGTTRRSLTAYD